MAIAVDAVSAADSGGANVASLTWSHTVAAGNERILIVGVSVVVETAATVTYGGTALTKKTALQNVDIEASLWFLVAPPVGAADIVVTFSAAARVVGGATSYTGVDPTTPWGTAATASGTSTAPSVTVTSAANELPVDAMACKGDPVITVGAGQTQRWNRSSGSGPSLAGSEEPGAASVVLSWSLNPSKVWALVAAPLKPSPPFLPPLLRAVPFPNVLLRL